MKIGSKIKNARLKSKLSQENLAKKLYVSRKTISSWENNRSYPSPDSIRELEQILNCNLKMKKASSKTHSIKFSKAKFMNIILVVNSIATFFAFANAIYPFAPRIYMVFQFLLDVFIFYYFNKGIIQIVRKRKELLIPIVVMIAFFISAQLDDSNKFTNNNIIDLVVDSIIIVYGLTTTLLLDHLFTKNE